MFRFENIGNKIRVPAKVIFVIECIVAFVGALLSVFLFNTYANVIGRINASPETPLPFWVGGLVGVLVLFVGMLFAWLSNLCLYGFGQLIADTTETKEITAAIYEILAEAASSPDPAPQPTISLTDEERVRIIKRINKLNGYMRDGQITQEQYNKELEKLKSILR